MSEVDLNLSSLFSVKGKIALVTGGGSGIGRMIAAGLVQNGAKVYIAARKEGQLKEISCIAATGLNKLAYGKVHYIVADVGTKKGCDALIKEFKNRESKLHILVNNSGVSWGAPFNDFPEEKGWDNIFSVNVKSIFYLTAGLTDLLVTNSTNIDPASVINISSVGSIMPEPEGDPLTDPRIGVWSYVPSKAAVNHLTSALAVKLAGQHVKVNAILPGFFPSKMTSFRIREIGAEKISEDQPTGRFGVPSDAAGLVIFLSSPASAHITGAHIVVDGGSRFKVSVKL